MKKYLVLFSLVLSGCQVTKPIVNSENSASSKSIIISNISENTANCYRTKKNVIWGTGEKFIIQPKKSLDIKVLQEETFFACTIEVGNKASTMLTYFSIEETGTYTVNLGFVPKNEIPVFKCGSIPASPSCSDENQKIGVAIVSLPKGRNTVLDKDLRRK